MEKVEKRKVKKLVKKTKAKGVIVGKRKAKKINGFDVRDVVRGIWVFERQ